MKNIRSQFEFRSLSAPVITGNTAASHGSGIYSAGGMLIEGIITLAGNAGNDDVYLSAGKKRLRQACAPKAFRRCSVKLLATTKGRVA